MKTNTFAVSRTRRRVAASLAFMMVSLAVAEGGNVMAMGASVHAPAASEFGLGPRATTQGTYQVALEPREPLRLRRLQTIALRIVDANGQPVNDAALSIDGGMPEHGHGLPTQPRVVQRLGDGVYEIEGLRFSMGGWWELKFAIDSPAGRDSVTFNLSL